MQVFGLLNGLYNELRNRRLESLTTDPGDVTGRFFFNTTDKRMKVADGNGGYRSVAWLSDVLGLSNWKSDVRVATTGNITLSGTQTIDEVSLNVGDKVLVKDQTNQTENGRYIVSSGAWTRSLDADIGEEITNSMCIVEEGTTNGGTIWKNTDNDPLSIGSDDIHFAKLDLTVPQKDETVKVSINDIAEKFLRESFTNVNASGDALNNLGNIQIILENPGAVETLRLALDLSIYTGDVTIDGGLTVTGTTTLNDLQFSTDSTINRDNTTNTGSQYFDSNYTSNYDGSTINYNNGTTVNQDSTSIYNNDGTTNYSTTSVINNSGTTNYDDNSVVNNYGGEVNNYGTTINNSSNPVLLGCSGNQTVNVAQVDTAINSEAEYAMIHVIYDNGGTNERFTDVKLDSSNSPLTVTDPASTYPGQITFTWNEVSGNIEAVRDSGSEDFIIDVCQYDLDANPTVINNDYTEINNDNTTTNNTNVTENYYSEFTSLGCSGSANLPVNEPIKEDATKADVTIVYNDGFNTETTVVIITEGTGIVTRDLLDATITVEWNTTSGNIEVRQTTGAGTAFADVCQFSGGTIINNDGIIENNTNNYINNDNTTVNNINVTEYYDESSTVINEGDVYNNNLTVENISYATTFVAGENLTNRQPVRMGVASLGEDTDKIYGANATDNDHAGFIGFVSKDALAGEEVSVLQGPRVSGLKEVYGALTDGATYYLTDAGGISTTAGTVNTRLGDADGDDTLVGLNAPIPEASKVPPKQMVVNNTPNVGDVLVYVDDDTFERGAGGAGGTMIPIREGIQDSGTDIVLSNTPVGGDTGLIVYKKDSGIVWFKTDDRTYDSGTNTVTLNTALTSGEKVEVFYWTYGGTPPPTTIVTNEITTNSASVTSSSFNLVTFSTGDVTVTLPDANTIEGNIISIKKFTGNDIYTVTINTTGGQTIDGLSNIVIDTDGNAYDFISMNGNRYIK